MFSSVKRVHNISSGAAGAAPGGGVSATTTHTPLATASTRKLEVARKLAAKITVTASAKPSDQVLDINQQTAAAMFNNGATGVGIAGPGVSPAMTAALAAAAAIPTNQSKSIAEQMAMKIHAKLGYSRPDEQDTEEVEEEFQYVDITMLKRYEEELEINDFPQTARWKVTSKVTLAQPLLYHRYIYIYIYTRVCKNPKYIEINLGFRVFGYVHHKIILFYSITYLNWMKDIGLFIDTR